MKIYDCFIFYNEFELLEFRLKALYNLVDYFVIVESNRTFTNKVKKCNFIDRADDFKQFFSKIKYVNVDLSGINYQGIGDWSIEIAQRNAISEGLKDADPEDLIFISDLDEFPSPMVVDKINDNTLPIIINCILPTPPPIKSLNARNVSIPCQSLIPSIKFLDFSPISLHQQLHYYYLDWVSPTPWFGTVICKFKNFTTPQKLREMRTILPRVPNGGYHFSYMGGVDRIIEKMTSIVDGNELVVKSNDDIIDREHVKQTMQSGKDLYKRDIFKDCLHCKIEDIKLPYVREFVEKYPQFWKNKIL